MMDSSARARIDVTDLKLLRKGKFDQLINVKEQTLDGDIMQALQFQKTGQGWILFPFDGGYEHEKYLRAIAEYRKEFPSPTLSVNTNNDKDSIFYKTLIKNQTDFLLKQYGN